MGGIAQGSSECQPRSSIQIKLQVTDDNLMDILWVANRGTSILFPFSFWSGIKLWLVILVILAYTTVLLAKINSHYRDKSGTRHLLIRSAVLPSISRYKH
jgi:hypothetical protein